jgi:copper chaperone
MKMKMSIALVGTVVLALIAVTRWTAATPQDHKSQATHVATLDTQVVTLKMTGMFCGGCEAAVQHAAREVDGVTAAQASSDKGIAEVTYDPAKTTPAAIAKVVTENSGFKAEVPGTAPNKT